MTGRISARARYGTALAVFGAFALLVWGAETLIAHRDPDLLWRDPSSGDDGLKFYRFHPKLGLFHKSDFSAEYRGVTYTTNSKGLRDGALDYARTPGRARVVLLGDSIVWGYGVSDGETLPDYLEHARPATEIVNLGVAGYGTGQELMLLRVEGLRYDPDLVLLVFTVANDVEDSYFPDTAEAYPANIYYLRDGQLRVAGLDVSPLERLALWLNQHSYLVSLALKARADREAGQRGSSRLNFVSAGNRERLRSFTVDLEHYRELRYLAPAAEVETRHYARRGGLLVPNASNHYKVELAKQLILEIGRASRGAGADFAVVLVPFRAQLDPRDAYAANPLNAELMRFLRSREVPALDLLPVFRERGLSPEQLYLDSMHFSADGNRLVAGLLAELLTFPEPRSRP